MALALPETERFLPSDRAVRRLYWILLAGWLLVLYFRFVGVDETEHAHVAWLMGARGLEPFNDFFQHHMPLLWEVLKLYYQLGGSGPEVLYFGRGVVLLCAVLSVWGFYVIATSGAKTRPIPMPPAMAGTAFFIITTLMLPELFGIRPETLAIPLFLWSYIFWVRSQRKDLPESLAAPLLSGILFGLTFLASPRLILLGGFFLWPTQDEQRAPAFDLKQLTILAIGALAALFGYIALSDTTFDELHFILSFSSLLQQVGEGEFPGRLKTVSAVLAAVAVLSLAVFYRFGRSDQHFALKLDLVYLVIVTLLSVLLAGKYIYSQDLSPVFVLIALLFIRGQNRLEQAPQLRMLFFGTTVALGVFLLSARSNPLFSNHTVVAHVQKIRCELTVIPPGESVMLHSGLHPILVTDASFYGNPLWDSQDRLCRTVRRAQADWSLPVCDFLADLKKNRPFLVTNATWALGAGDKLEGIKDFLDKHYMRCGRFHLRLSGGPNDPDVDDAYAIFRERCLAFAATTCNTEKTDFSPDN